MNKLQTIENEDNYLDLSKDNAVLLLCKQFVKPLNSEFAIFIFNNVNPLWLDNKHYQNIFKISKKYWETYQNIIPIELLKQCFNNSRFKSEDTIELNNSLDSIVSFNDSSFSEKFIKDTLIKTTRNLGMQYSIIYNLEALSKNKDGVAWRLFNDFGKFYQLDIDENLGVEYFENFDEHCNKLAEGINNKIPFNWNKFDKYTYGGLPKNDTCLFLLMAQPGLGKSMFMINMGYQFALQGKKVLFISLEMSEHEYSKRFDGLFSDLDINTLKDNLDTLKVSVKNAKINAPTAQIRIKEFPTGTLTTGMLKQFLDKLEKTTEFVPEIIFVDYLNIMKPNGYNTSMSLYEKCGKIAEELRALSSEKKIPCISAIQSNRSGSGGGYPGEDIDIGNASESSGIVATADALFALYQLENERDIDRINVKILKNRLGSNVGTKFPMRIDYNGKSLKVSDWEDDTSIKDDLFENAVEVSAPTPRIKENEDGTNLIFEEI